MLTITSDRLRLLMQRHTENVFRTMLGVDARACQSASGTGKGGSSVVALVGLTGRWSGHGVVTCSGDVARSLSGRMLLTEFARVDSEVLDAIGEIANMVIGNVKEDLTPDLGPLAITTPTVVCGDGLQTHGVTGGVGAALTFVAGDDELEVRVSLVRSGRHSDR